MLAMLTPRILFWIAICMVNVEVLVRLQYYYSVVMFSKYLDYSEPAAKAHSLAQGECEQKDVVIGQLKGEIYELKQLEGDFTRLSDLIHGLEGKYSLLLSEKQRSEKEQRLKSEIDKKSTIELRGDIDDLRVQLQKANLLIEDLLRSNTNIKRQTDARCSQIQAVRFQIKELENKNQRSNDQNRGLAVTLKALKQERKRIEDECEQLSAHLDGSMARLKAVEKEVRGVESGNARLEKTLYQAEKDNGKLVGELKEKNEEIKRAEGRLKGVSHSIADVTITYKNLQQQTAKTKGELQRNNAVLGAEAGKGREVQGRIAAVESTIRGQEAELDGVIAEEERLRKEHFAALEKNKGLNLEIDRVLALIGEYETVNRELLDEIDLFAEQDQQVRSMLDRQALMQDIVDSSLRKIALTEEPIKHLKC